jgi:hypothetical protein
MDNDDAGRKSEERIRKMLVNEIDTNINYLHLEQANDPTVFIQDFGVKPLVDVLIDINNSV